MGEELKSGELSVKVKYKPELWSALEKVARIKKISRKRARKLYMSVGINKRKAEFMARNFNREERFVRWMMKLYCIEDFKEEK